jgi:hypothetical protein
MTQDELNKLIEDLQREYYTIPNDDLVALVNWVRINYYGDILPMNLIHKLCETYDNGVTTGWRRAG